jgi:uncharacterized protein YybS (DUF2232 family)
MPSQETRLFALAGAAVCASGLFWIVPGLNILSSIAAIAGLILVVLRLGYFRAFMVSLAGVVFVAADSSLIFGGLLGAVNVAIFLLAVVAPGIAMGIAARSFASPVKTVWYGCLPIIFLFGMLMVFYSDMVGNLPTILRQVNTSMAATIDDSPALSKMIEEQYGQAGDGRDKFLAYIDKLIIFLAKMIPATIIIAYLSVIIISLTVAGKVAARFNLMVPRFRPFHLWRASEWWLLPTAVGLALAIFAPGDFWRYFGGNILLISGSIYAFTGLAFLDSIIKRISASPLVRMIFFVIILILSGMVIGLIFLAVLGLADSRFRFTRESPEHEEDNVE